MTWIKIDLKKKKGMQTDYHKAIVLVLVLFGFPALGQSELQFLTKPPPFDPLSCEIDFHCGITGAVLGYSKVADILDCFGAGKMDSEKVPWTPGLSGRFWITTIDYPEYGIKFEFRHRRKNNKHHVLHQIILYGDHCPCYSKDGIGIGSTYDAIANSCLGESRHYAYGENLGYSAILYYRFQIAGPGEDVSITFYGDDPSRTHEKDYRLRAKDFVAKLISIVY